MAELLLPADLMIEILLRLPVKSLLRFRCVSKGWRDLIDSRNFSKSHLNRLPDRTPYALVLRHNREYDIVDLISVINGGPALAFKEHPLPPEGRSVYFEGHCNGLVCISHYWGALLWNPATGKQFAFEFPPQGFRLQNWEFGYDKDSDDYKVVARLQNWGFGYDKDSDDYKVVAVAKEEGWYFVWIYSLRSHSWKRINDFPYIFARHDEAGVFVNGALHWKVYQGENVVPVISSLHLGKLVYSLIPVPDYNSENTSMEFEYLGALDGRLCAVFYDCEDFDLWTMNEYGVNESWTKLIRCANYATGLVSSVYLQDDEVLLFSQYFEKTMKTIGCEFRRISIVGGREIKRRSSLRLSSGYWPYIYVPSLVCPQNGC